MNFIISHLGGGCSTAFHRKGKIIDMVASGEGTFSISRAGRFSTNTLIKLCYSNQYKKEDLLQYMNNNAGLIAHLGTNNCQEIEERITAGDLHAKNVYEAFAYNISKDIGTMSVVGNGDVDCIIITGGVAHSKMLTELIEQRVNFIAHVEVFPGSIEMEALAHGVLRVLRGKESYRKFSDPF